MAKPSERAPIYGYIAEFEDVDSLVAATKATKDKGWRWVEAYTPMPVHELTDVLGCRNRLPKIILIGGIVGALVGFGMQYYASVHSYPQNIGGRPLNSWPSFIVVTFELTILFAAFSAVLGMLALNGLPRPHHPVFSVPGFDTASRDRFFLILGSRDELFDMEGTKAFLEGQKPLSVHEVPHE
jgi:hypothetical protein